MTEPTTASPAPASEHSGYMRVRAFVTFTAEYFVPADEYVRNDADALANIRSGLRFIEPDNILVEHQAVLTEPIFGMDDNGPHPEDVARVARDWAEVWRPDDVDRFVTEYVTYVADQTRMNDRVAFPGAFARFILDPMEASA